MEYYVGLDVSLKQTSICVVDQAGSVVREGVVDSDPEAISGYGEVKGAGRGTCRPVSYLIARQTPPRPTSPGRGFFCTAGRLGRFAQIDQRTALPDQCLHSAEADV